MFSAAGLHHSNGGLSIKGAWRHYLVDQLEIDMFRAYKVLLKAEPLVLSACLLFGSALFSMTVHAAPGDLEKEELTLGFIKLTDMAPLAIAYEKRFFEDEGLYVTLEAQANWKV
ncbi:MAG TPA: ABC transporter substrate-binding protein, partial [Methylotenera sp.]|nr:ABC transporter substrate-binding protein [Methylotenera sp.]